jgi:Protein of unknown function (DUF5672)
MVDIVIPIYKPQPDENDLLSLHRTFEVLKAYRLCFVHPKSMDLSAYKKRFEADYKAFDDAYFANIQTYNHLMLSLEFYQAFDQKYLLICQTDAFVFEDQLSHWVAQDFDYIGAPWLRSSDTLPVYMRLQHAWAQCLAKINYQGKGKAQKDKSLMYNAVGNGGFSLRKREKFIEVLQEIPQVAQVYKAHFGDFYNEDVFWSIEAQRHGISYHKPDYQTACLFAIENKAAKALAYHAGKLPFGCHAWDKSEDFWRPYFKQVMS